MNTRLKVASILAGAALATTTILNAGAAGVNIVPNGDFSDGTTAHWNVVGDGKLQEDGGIGVLANVNNKLGLSSTTVTYQCLPVKEGKQYHFFAATRIPGNQERTGEARWTTAFYPTNNCGGVALDIQQFAPFSETSGWRTDSGDLVRNSSKTAYSMSVALTVKKDATNRLMKKGELFIVRFDNVKVLETSIPGPKPTVGEASDDGGPVIEPPAPPTKDVEPQPVTPTPAPETPVEADDAEDDSGAVPPTVDPAAPTELDPAAIPGIDSPATGDGAASGDVDEEPETPSPEGPNDVSADGDDSNEAPAEIPTLEPQDSNGPLHSATPIPPPPATGGDSATNPADDLDSHDSQADAAGRSSDDGDGGLPIGLFSLFGVGGLGFLGIIAVAARRKSRD